MLGFVGAPLDGGKTYLLQAARLRRHWERLPEAARDWARLAATAAEGKATREGLDDAYDELGERSFARSGGAGRSWAWRGRRTAGRSTRCRCWPTPCRRRGATTRTS